MIRASSYPKLKYWWPVPSGIDGGMTASRSSCKVNRSFLDRTGYMERAGDRKYNSRGWRERGKAGTTHDILICSLLGVYKRLESGQPHRVAQNVRYLALCFCLFIVQTKARNDRFDLCRVVQRLGMKGVAQRQGGYVFGERRDGDRSLQYQLHTLVRFSQLSRRCEPRVSDFKC